MDHEHFRLKVLYKQKKKISSELKSAKTEIKGLEACISALETLCKEAGIPEKSIRAKLMLYRKTQHKSSAMSALAGFAVGGDCLNPVKNDNVTDVRSMTSEENNSVGPKTSPDGLDKLAKQTVLTVCNLIEAGDSGECNNLRTLDLRTRSNSSIEPGEGGRRRLSPTFIRKLAESSARFIATMHQGTTDERADPESLQEKHAEGKDQLLGTI